MKRSRRSTLPPLASLGDPPAVRLTNQSAMRRTWRDPDDTKPGASHKPREITGWRTFCPLRRMMGIAGSSVTTEHILAADRLRAAADAVAIGYSGPREFTTVQAIMRHGPNTGFGQAALRSARAWPVFRGAMRLFCEGQRELLTYVVLQNLTVNKWVTTRREAGLQANATIEMGRLLSCLDVLAEHFKAEVEQDQQRRVMV